MTLPNIDIDLMTVTPLLNGLQLLESVFDKIIPLFSSIKDILDYMDEGICDQKKALGENLTAKTCDFVGHSIDLLNNKCCDEIHKLVRDKCPTDTGIDWESQLRRCNGSPDTDIDNPLDDPLYTEFKDGFMDKFNFLETQLENLYNEL